MFRQAVFFLAVFSFGVISSLDFSVPEMESAEDFRIEMNGNLSIVSATNTNNEISHQVINYEPLKFVADVEGLIHYAIGARRSSEYGIFFVVIETAKTEVERMENFYVYCFGFIHLIGIISQKSVPVERRLDAMCRDHVAVIIYS